MKRIDTVKRISTTVISGLFILLFTYAAVSKLVDFQRFSVELGKSPLLVSFSFFVAWLIPALEILICVLLITERFRLFALYASFALMVLFTAYLVCILNFSDFIPCTCGGVLQELTWRSHIIFNIIFILLAAIAVMLYDKDFVLQYNRRIRKPV